MERLTVKEAADRLGISQGAVRKRIQRGTIPNAKRPEDGRVYVFLDSDTEDGSQESELELDEQKTLHYIDKLYSSWQSVSASAKRLALVIVLISLLLLVLAGGGASTEQSLTLSGIGLKIPFVVFLIVGAASFVVLPSIYFYLDDEQHSLEEEIQRLYIKIGVDDANLQKATAGMPPGPFGTGNLVETFSLTFRGGAVTDFVVVGIYLTLPIAAQVAAGFKAAELLQKQSSGWVWILFYLLVAMTLVASYWVLESLSSEPDKTLTGKTLQEKVENIFVFFNITAVPGAALGFLVANGLSFL
jgi:excisionase family DNA binding protein